MNYKQIILEALQLNEASLGRLYQHLKNKDPIAFVSGDREDSEPGENKANRANLKRYLNLSGFGYNRIKGGYVEEGGKRVDAESSFVIYSDKAREEQLRDLAIALGKKYKQSSILFVDSEGQAKFISTRNDSWVGPFGQTMKLGKFKTTNINDFYTKIGNKEFKFDSLTEESDLIDNAPSVSDRCAREAFMHHLESKKDNVIDYWETEIIQAGEPINEDYLEENFSNEKLVDQINQFRDHVAAAPKHKLDKDEHYQVRSDIERILDNMPVGIVLMQDTDAGEERYTKINDKQFGWERLRQPFKDVREQSSFDIAQWLIAPAWVDRGPVKFKMQ